MSSLGTSIYPFIMTREKTTTASQVFIAKSKTIENVTMSAEFTRMTALSNGRGLKSSAALFIQIKFVTIVHNVMERVGFPGDFLPR